MAKEIDLENLNIQAVFQSLQKGECFQDVLGWSDELMNELYDCLKELNTQNRWDEAIDASTFLLTVNPFIPSFYVEAGYAYQNKHQLEEAISLYSLGALHSIEDPQPLLYLVTCYQTLGDLENATKSLESAILLIEQGPTQQWAALLPDLKETLNILKEQHGSPSD